MDTSESECPSTSRLVRLCALDEVEPNSSIRVDVDGFRLAVVRCDDDVYVIGDRCTHQDISLSEGEVDCRSRTIECWKHGSQFRLDDGEPEALPATKPTPTYAVTVTDGDIYAELAS